jgi:ribosomal protein L23
MLIKSAVRTEKWISKMEFAKTVVFEVSDDAEKGSVATEAASLFGAKVKAVRMYISPKGKKRAIIRFDAAADMNKISEKLKMI